MYCNNCGASSPDGVKFCANCGMALIPTLNVPESAPEEAPIFDTPQPTAPMYTPVPEAAPEAGVPAGGPAYGQDPYAPYDPNAYGKDPYGYAGYGYDPQAYSQTPVVPQEIINSIFTNGLLSTIFAYIPLISFLGIVFSVIAKKKSNQMIAAYGYQPGKARAGRILSIVGLVSGIVMTVFYLFYFIVIALVIVYGN